MEDALQTLGKLTQEMGVKAGNSNLPSTSSGDSNAVTQQDETQQDAIQHWLLPSDPFQNYDQARMSRHEGTAQWFLKNKTFVKWESSGSFLWVNGKRMFFFELIRSDGLYPPAFIAGSGKSVIRSVVSELLLRKGNSCHC
jgi:hypothetical protein